MPWKEIKGKPHACHMDGGLPPPQEAHESGAHEGSLYECDTKDCGKLWQLTNDARGGSSSWLWVEYFPHPGD